MILKRVALDFQWPCQIPWKGYVNPYSYQECPVCRATGLNEKTRKIQRGFSSFGIRWCESVTQEEFEAVRSAGHVKPEITLEEARTRCKLWYGSVYSEEGVNFLVRLRAEREGVFGFCPMCAGSGKIWFDEEVNRLHEAWKPVDPPSGPGFQAWDDEGTYPISQVFATEEEFQGWVDKLNLNRSLL